jgi:hypothetical protein
MIEPGDIQELRARVANLEAIVEQSLQRSRWQPAQRGAAGDGPAKPGATSRRSLLSLLAGAGAASVLAATARADSAAPARAALGAWKTYSPKLMGEKADPVLGDDQSPKIWTRAGRNGHYWQYGRTVVVKTWIQFGPGAKPGSGHYRLSLPVPAATGSDAWLGPTGVALLHCAATKINRNATVILPHSDFVVFQLDDSARNVGHDNPWVWGPSDGLNTFTIYEAAKDP